MGYQINFSGAVTPELGQLLHAVEGQLNWRGIHAQSGDTASSASAASSTGAPGGESADTHSGHEPSVAVVGTVALVVGLAVGYLVGKSSASSSSKTVGATQ